MVLCRTRFAKARAVGQRRADIRGVDIISSYRNVGAGMGWKLNKPGPLSIYAHDAADVCKEGTIHTGNIGFAWN